MLFTGVYFKTCLSDGYKPCTTSRPFVSARKTKIFYCSERKPFISPTIAVHFTPRVRTAGDEPYVHTQGPGRTWWFDAHLRERPILTVNRHPLPPSPLCGSIVNRFFFLYILLLLLIYIFTSSNSGFHVLSCV